MPYYQLYYHIVWSTKYRAPILTPEIEAILYLHIRTKARELGGKVFSLNGWVDHCHLVAGIPPKISLAQFDGQVKGYSTFQFNRSGHPSAPVFWQTEYSAFTVSARVLPTIIRYVDQQKEHHRVNSTIADLEEFQGEKSEEGFREDMALYRSGVPE